MTLAARRLLLLVSLGTALALPRPASAEAYAEVSFGASLAPYGEWVVVAHHGRVWRPRGVAAGWRPYFHGRWVWTDDGWFWDSDEPWGWACYHYGRWYVDPAYGWVWVPGYTWAPAWVTWRFGAGAIGWAPLLPGLSVWWTVGYPVQQSSWVFVPDQHFAGARVDSVAYAPARSAALLSTTRVAPPRRAGGASAPRLGGPPRQFVERRMGRPITPVRVTAASTPQAGRAGRSQGVVSVYRPRHLVATRTGPASATGHAAAERPAHGTAAHAAPQAMAGSAQRAATGHAAPRRTVARSAPHPATAHAVPRAPATSARHAPAARATPRAAPAHTAAHLAPARSRPEPAARPSAPSQHASSPGRPAPQRQPHPARARTS